MTDLLEINDGFSVANADEWCCSVTTSYVVPIRISLLPANPEICVSTFNAQDHACYLGHLFILCLNLTKHVLISAHNLEYSKHKALFFLFLSFRCFRTCPNSFQHEIGSVSCVYISQCRIFVKCVQCDYINLVCK